MKPFISVAMATYNGEKFIIQQLESILEQTYPVDEIVICDDRSSDGTIDVIRNFVREKSLQERVTLVTNEQNLGYASNFMKAVRLTKGDYVFFCDQDDIWLSDRVENMVRVMEDNRQISLLGSEFEPFKSSEDAPDVPKWELAKFKNDGSLEKMSFCSPNIFIGCQGCTMVVRRAFLDEIDSYWYEGWAHDEFVWKLALSRNELFFYHKVTLKRRLHSGNVTLHKEHEKDKRLKYLRDLYRSHERTEVYIEKEYKGDDKKKRLELMNRHKKATKLRISLIEEKKLGCAIRLFGYTDCYHKMRSIPVELLMALR